MQTLFTILVLLSVLMTGLWGLVLWHILHRLDLVSDHLRQVMKQTESPAVRGAGGRTWPTPDELLAARNRIDQTGTAHTGGPG